MTASMYYLAHISDIHLAPLPQPSCGQLIGKRLTGYINWKKKRGQQLGTVTLDHLMRELHMRGPNHLLISGDLVNLALDQEFANAYSWLQQQGDPSNVSLTFGNHDAYVRGAFKKACTLYSPWIQHDIGFPRHTPFPYMRIRDRVAIIGVSSAIATPPFFATGYFSAQQAKQMAQLLKLAKEKNLFRVVMIHHPPLFHATPWHKKLWGIRRFQKTIANHGAELIVHGHTHLPTLSYIDSKNMPSVPVVGVSSASQTCSGKKPPANYNWFAIDQCKHGWSCTLSRYGIIDHNNTVQCIETKKLF